MSSVNYSLKHKGVKLIPSEKAWTKTKTGKRKLNSNFVTSISEDELQSYEVEANDAYQAEEYFKQFIRDLTGITIYSIGKKDAPHEEYDAHSCSAEADEFGFCTVCGAIVHGSQADYELHGYDPPDTY